MASKKKSRMETWFDMPRDEMEKLSKQFGKAVLAHKTEQWNSQYAHDEYMEQAELWAEQNKDQ